MTWRERIGHVRWLMLGVLASVVIWSTADLMLHGGDFAPSDRDRVRVKRTARGFGQGSAADPRTSVPDSTTLIGGNGLVEPLGREIRIGSAVAGLVKRVLVKEGQQVKAGQPLVQLDDSLEEAAVKIATADLGFAIATLRRTRGALRWEDRRAAYADADAARARAQLAQQNYERIRKLVAQGAATEQDRDNAKLTAQSESASAKAMAERARAAKAGARADDLSVSVRAVMQAEARLASARATRQRLLVRAPRAGQILQVLVRAGEYFSPAGPPLSTGGPASGSWLLVLGDTGRLQVRMDVDERDISKVKVGARAYVTADAFGSRRFEGVVVEIGRRMGRKNVRTDEPTDRIDTTILEVVLKLDGVSKELVPGLRVAAYVSTK
ncbi:MAG: efflux RND transporter periplasmic adaptor subunit [Myxococcales bacterium]|nr:efflux RND transporter periplasmic adaptor subunit [Myxococcales bacterium]